MTREQYTKLTRDKLDQYGLSDWHVRLTTDLTKPFLGLCSYKDKCIILNAHHLDMHPEPEIVNTILHEIAHALMPGHAHDEFWASKAREIGCTSTQPCSHLSFSPEIIDAIRSGADIQVDFETEIIHRPKYSVTRLQDKCPVCGKVAKELFSFESVDKDGNTVKMITLECYHIQKKIIPRGTPFETLISNGHEERVKNCQHSFGNGTPNKCVKCGEYRPYQFQVDGMRFLEAALAINKGGAVFDEMGLGKTVQALGYIKFHPETLPVLFVVKSGIMFQWFKEIIRWLGPEYLAQIIKTSRDTVLPGLKCYIISYDLLRRFDHTNELNHIKTVVLDECQLIKNPDSTRTQEVRRLVKNAQHVIPLSGTPWKNRGSEFFTVLNMLAPQKFFSYQNFISRWVDFYFHGNKYKEGGIRKPEQFKEYIKDIAIRRERSEVMKELPLINRVRHYTEIDDSSQKEYDEKVVDFVKAYNDAVIGGDEDTFGAQSNMVAKLQKMRHLIGLAKIPATVDYVKNYLEEAERKKIVVFVHHKDVGYLLAEEIKKNIPSDIPILKLTAEHSSAERFEIQEQFNKLESVVMIGSTLASGEGLNLQSCSHCVMHERQWNPANEEQAEGRFIRIGQTADSVTATYITAAGTVDEHLDGVVERKRIDFHNAMNKGQMPVWKQTDIIKELADSIVKDYNTKNKSKLELVKGNKVSA